MSSGQQKQIKAFLLEELGKDRSSAPFEDQEKILASMIAGTKGKSKGQIKTLHRSILPCLAMYKALLNSGLARDAAYTRMQTYMLDHSAARSHSMMAKMELIPGFYTLYSSIFLRVVRTSDLWESRQAREGDYFDVTIRKCLWHTACAEYGCPELCRLFCDSDDVTYGGLKKLGFTRTKTLGHGDDCCDFHFFRK